MKQKSVVIRIFTAAAAAGIPAALLPVSAHAYELEQHSQEEIRAFYAAHPFSYRDEQRPVYKQPQMLTAPYTPGVLSDETIQESLNSVMFARYLAGVPYDIEAKPELNRMAQTASFIGYSRGWLSHSLEREDCPQDMSDEMIAYGEESLKNCCLELGYCHLPAAIYEKDLCDSDMRMYQETMNHLGHRRRLLDPKLKYIGFGQTEKYSAVYSHDQSRTEAFTGGYIAWPPENMPVELYKMRTEPYQFGRYPFSVSLMNGYAKPSLETVQVDLYSHQLDRTFHFDKDDFFPTESPLKGDEREEACRNYFNVNTSLRSTSRNCIIFCPDVFLAAGDTVDVTVSGIQYTDGTDAVLTYSVNFFSLEPEPLVAPADSVRGDTDVNGCFDVRDAVLLNRVLAEDETCIITQEGLDACDYDEDGFITLSDLSWMIDRLSLNNPQP